jgi:formate dehydrogenase maturation protein FdhE
MVQIDLTNVRIKCNNCGHVQDLDLFEIPAEVECCNDPEIILEDDIELIVN